MTTTYAVQRRFTRIFFSDKVRGIISSVDNKQDSISVTLLNISEGGLQCTLQRNPDRKFQVNAYLILKKIHELPELTSLTDIPMQIKWIMDNEHLDHITIGAEFCELSKDQHEALSSFVSNCLSVHKQDNVA